MAKYEIKNLKQTFEVSFKTFWRKWEEGVLPKWFSIFKQLEKCKNEPLQSKFNKFLQAYLIMSIDLFQMTFSI